MSTELPMLISSENSESSSQINFEIGKDLKFFDGHFPGKPIVPGYILLSWALRYAKQNLGLSYKSFKANSVKFLRMVTPGLKLALNLKFELSSSKLSFSYTSEDGEDIFCSGILILE